MHQPYKELLCKNNLSFKSQKENAGLHLLPACLLMSKILCFCLQSISTLNTEVFLNGLKYIFFFFLYRLRNTCKPIRLDLHWVPRSLECLSVILVKKLSLSQVSWRDIVAFTQVTPEIFLSNKIFSWTRTDVLFGVLAHGFRYLHLNINLSLKKTSKFLTQSLEIKMRNNT